MIKNRKLLSIVVLSVSICCLNLSTSYADASSFTDTSINYWGYESIQWAVDNKIVTGYPDGTFKPDQDVIQDEFIAMLIRAYQPTDFTPNTDSPYWSTAYLNYWSKLGWHLITPSDAILSRGQVAQYLVNATGKNYTIDDSIQYLLDTGMTNGKTGPTLEGFKKEDAVTRAEAVTFIKRLKQFNTKLQQNVVVPSIVYENTKNNFTINLPKSWEGKYDVVDRTDAANIENISFINIANKEYGGVLFTISIWPTEKWISDGQETAKHIQISKIGEKGDTTFTLSTPSDVEWNVSDEKLKAEYLSMSNDIKTIKTSFKTTN